MSGQTNALVKVAVATPQLRMLLNLLTRSLRGPGISVLSLIGPAVKWAIVLLLAINARSFPLIWHVRIFQYIYRWHTRRFLWWALGRDDERFIQRSCPIGKNPLEVMHVMPGFTTIDDCDVFGHLSNSSYAKTLDIARFQFLIDNLLPWYGEKGVTALGGSHYSFIKEIRPLRSYEMRTCLGAWDNKWIYLVSYFITYPKKGRSKDAKSQDMKPPAHLPANMLPEGAVLHCVAVSRYCFKMKRLTVPPTVAISLSGFGATGEIGWARWHRKNELRDQGKLGDVLRGAWAPEIARPTEEGGWGLQEFEQGRLEGMQACEKLGSGLDMMKAYASPVSLLTI